MTILSPEAFLDNPHMTGAMGVRLYPELRRRFLAAFEFAHRDSVVLCGGIGWGRSELAALMLYYAAHHAIETSDPAILDVRELVMVGHIRERAPHGFEQMREVPYFRDRLERDSYRRMEFKGGLRVSFRGSFDGAKGHNERPLGGLIELLNYNPAASIRAALYPMRAARREGDLPLLIAVMEGPPPHADARTYVAELTTWDSRPASHWDGPYFFVRYGGGLPIATLSLLQIPDAEGKGAHWVDDAGCHYLAVPIEFRAEFDHHPAQALWDRCGVQAL